MNHVLIWMHKPVGFVAIGFVLVQLITGPRWIKWRPRIKVHRVTGFITVGFASLHASIGIYLNYFLR